MTAQDVAEAYETYGTKGQGPLVLTCEHASQRLPLPWRATPSDRTWLNTHWGWDIGARIVTRTIASASGSWCICARFSRLLCDANRPPDSPTFIRTQVEGAQISFNQALDQADIKRRTDTYHHAYHKEIDRGIEAHQHQQPFLLAVHSFTPVWDGVERTVDVGVLFDHYEAQAEVLRDGLARQGFRAALNEPYTAMGGLAYSAQRHGQRHELPYLELEVNQKLIQTPSQATSMGHCIAQALGPLITKS